MDSLQLSVLANVADETRPMWRSATLTTLTAALLPLLDGEHGSEPDRPPKAVMSVKRKAAAGANWPFCSVLWPFAWA